MNSPPLIVRLALLALLPCIAALLYVRGRNYDAALIDFRAASEKPASLAAVAAQSGEPSPAETIKGIAGFRQVGKERRYTKDNLYEHVDGHAEYFISAGFQGLTVTEYDAEDSKAAKAGLQAEAQPELQAEVYDMGKSIQAFGVLSDESGENAQPASAGSMGFRNPGGINFIKGKYYVKVTAYNPKARLLQFAQTFGDTLPGAQESFAVFSRLPNLGKAGKTRYIKEGYRGMDFLNNVIEREYSAGKGKISVALLAEGDAEAKKRQAALFDYFDKSGTRYEKVESEGQVYYRVIDKYEGNWLLIPSRNGLFGVFGTEDEKLVKYFVKEK